MNNPIGFFHPAPRWPCLWPVLLCHVGLSAHPQGSRPVAHRGWQRAAARLSDAKPTTRTKVAATASAVPSSHHPTGRQVLWNTAEGDIRTRDGRKGRSCHFPVNIPTCLNPNLPHRPFSLGMEMAVLAGYRGVGLHPQKYYLCRYNSLETFTNICKM